STNPLPREARVQLELAARLAGDSASTLDMVAWLLATHPDARVRDAAAALEFAQSANRSASEPSAQYLRTLAASYAEARRFPEAIEIVRQASSLAESSGQKTLSEQCSKMLETFAAGQPFRQSARLLT